MIKYNNSNISDWFYNSSDIIKVYRNNAVCYYKIGGTPPAPTAQTPCYAVVENISQYSDTEFEDVFNKGDNKWYKLNNLDQYEQYGIYGSGRTITYYDGKLTIDTESTPQPSRLPAGYTEVEYIRQNSNYDAYINTGVILFDNTSNTYTVTTKLTSEFHSNLGCATIISVEVPVSPYNGMGYRYKCSSTVDQLEFFGGNSNYTSSVVDNGDGTRTVTFQSTGNTSWTSSAPLSLLCSFSDTSFTTPFRYADATIYSATIVKNSTTVRDFVPAKRDSDSVYGLYDLITDTFYTSPNGNNFSGGSEVIPPPITATCEFMYSGGSWVNLGEVSGSTIIIKSPEYIERTSTYNGYCSLLEYLTEDTKFIIKHKQTNAGGGRIIGDYNSNDRDDWRFFFAGSALYYDFITQRQSTSKSIPMSAAEEWEVGNYYIKNTATGTNLLTGSTQTFSSRPSPLYIYHSDGVGAGESGTDYGQIWYVKIYKNNVLVRDFIPWTDMNGNYGLYDKVENELVHTVGSMTASTTINDVEVGGGTEYPLEYVVREDPPDNVVFTSMEEAEEYECPWYGMSALIAGEDYMFCEGNEWLTKYSYVEVAGDYICDNGDKYKKMQEYDRQADGTTSPTSNYVKGDLIESGSPDCSQHFDGKWIAYYANGNVAYSAECSSSTAITKTEVRSGSYQQYKTVIIGDCVKRVREAFQQCTSMTDLEIGTGVTESLYYAFEDCTALTAATWYATSLASQDGGFQRCSALQKLVIYATNPPTLSSTFFNGVPSSLIIYVPDSAISAYQSKNYWKNYTIKGHSEL